MFSIGATLEVNVKNFTNFLFTSNENKQGIQHLADQDSRDFVNDFLEKEVTCLPVRVFSTHKYSTYHTMSCWVQQCHVDIFTSSNPDWQGVG